MHWQADGWTDRLISRTDQPFAATWKYIKFGRLTEFIIDPFIQKKRLKYENIFVIRRRDVFLKIQWISRALCSQLEVESGRMENRSVPVYCS